MSEEKIATVKDAIEHIEAYLGANDELTGVTLEDALKALLLINISFRLKDAYATKLKNNLLSNNALIADAVQHLQNSPNTNNYEFEKWRLDWIEKAKTAKLTPTLPEVKK